MTPAKYIGQQVEELVLEELPGLKPATVPEEYGNGDDDYWCDVEVTELVVGSSDVSLVDVCAVSPGTMGEIKAARRRISDGPGERHGRFKIRRRQHEKLVENGAVYIFVVYEGDVYNDELVILGVLFVPAVVVEDLRPDWYNGQDFTQISWIQLPISVPQGVAADAA